MERERRVPTSSCHAAWYSGILGGWEGELMDEFVMLRGKSTILVKWN